MDKHDAPAPRFTAVETPRGERLVENLPSGPVLRIGMDPTSLLDGKPVWEHIDDVRRFKREGRLEEALALSMRCIEQTDAPGYYREAAIALRKLGRLDDEIALLERFARLCHAPGATPQLLLERLEKARAKAAPRGTLPRTQDAGG